MRKFSNVFAAVFLIAAGSFAFSKVSPSNPAELSFYEQQEAAKITVMNNITSMPLTFTENQGQWDSKVLYRSDAGNATVWFTKEGVTYQFTRRIPPEPIPYAPRFAEQGGAGDAFETMTLKADFVNGNPTPAVSGKDLMEYKCNYFLGNDPQKWRTDVPNYDVITYKEIYPGIDLQYYGNTQRMEYDFVVSPGADPSQICIHYEGAKSLSVDEDGQLVIETEWGSVTELKPVVYQTRGSERCSILGEYVILGESSFGFKLSGEYNPQLALMIDPQVAFSTYLGGTSSDYGNGVAVDGAGSAYVCGTSYSTDFPLTPGAYDTTSDVSNGNIFITKFSSAGNSLIYSTLLGGSGYEWPDDMDIDSSGSAFVTGYTYSSDFPTTPGAIDNIYNANQDIFVVRLSSAGDSLIYGTYYGGSSSESGYGIAATGDGHAVLTGYTYSNDFPIANAFDESPNGGSDAFVAKFTPAGDSIIFSTYYGGSGYEESWDIAIDDLGFVSVVGYTYSTNIPTMNAYDNTGDANGDAFVAQFTPAGDSLRYGTYLGGTSYDYGYGINKFRPGINDNRYIYVTGMTYSGNFPTTPDGYDKAANGSYDVFITKLAPSIGGAGSLIYSTFYGGSSDDYGYGIGVDENENIYSVGFTYSTNLPMVNSTYGSNSGGYEGFVAKFVPGLGTGNGLIYSTYFGGSSDEYPQWMALDNHNNVYFTSQTYSSNLPVINAYDNTYNSGDAFLAKIEIFSADHTDIAVGAASGNYDTMKVAYSGGSGAVTGLVYYRQGGEVSYTSGALITGTGNSLFFPFTPSDTLPAARALEYYLEITRAGYTEHVGGTVKPMIYTPLLTNIQAQRPMETTAGRFKIIGVPISLSGDSSCSAVFSDDLGGNYKSGWRLASYDGSTHSYKEFPGAAKVKPGQGYWLITKAATKYGAVGRAVQPNRIYNSMYFYEVPLDSGWNLLANPFPFNVSTLEILIDTGGVVVSGWPTAIVDPHAYWYSGTEYVDRTSIPEWDGFFVNIKRHGVKALFPYHEDGATKKILPLASSYPGETGPGDWQVDFQLKANGCIDDGNFIGVRSDALEGLDDYDNGEPPPPPGGPSLALKSTETDTYLKRCDFRPPFDDGAEWYLTFTKLSGRVLTVSGIKQIPYNMDAWLILDDGSKMKLEEGSVVNLPDKVESARLLIGDEGYLRNNGSVVVPKVFALEQNYPNPFNPITTIKFALPEPASVRLEVYNLLGQRVITLIDKELPAGDYTTRWEGTDNSGQPVASGVYLYRIDAGKFKSSKKMILLK